MLDWLALWEIDPWGPGRDDKRAAVLSIWNRGGKFEDIEPAYPYIGSGSEDDEELIALLDADHEDLPDGCQARTTEPEDNR